MELSLWFRNGLRISACANGKQRQPAPRIAARRKDLRNSGCAAMSRTSSIDERRICHGLLPARACASAALASFERRMSGGEGSDSAEDLKPTKTAGRARGGGASI